MLLFDHVVGPADSFRFVSIFAIVLLDMFLGCVVVLESFLELVRV